LLKQKINLICNFEWKMTHNVVAVLMFYPKTGIFIFFRHIDYWRNFVLITHIIYHCLRCFHIMWSRIIRNTLWHDRMKWKQQFTNRSFWIKFAMRKPRFHRAVHTAGSLIDQQCNGQNLFIWFYWLKSVRICRSGL